MATGTGRDDSVLTLQIREVALQAAHEAGEILRTGLSRDPEIFSKGAFDIVTDVDRRSEETICRLIREAFPDHGILSEERRERSGAAPYRWVVDPLDGTINYAHHFPFFCVSIGVEREGVLQVGVVYDPIREELFAAMKGGGATLNGRPLTPSTVDDLSHALLATGFSPEVHEGDFANVRHFEAFLQKTQAVRRPGSAALDICYVAAGRLDGFWEMHLHPWDMAAGALIVQEAGGKVTNFAGQPFSLTEGEILVSNARIHEAMTQVLTRRDR